MSDEVDQVSYGEIGYHTFEDEIEAKREAWERYRRHLLSCVRGRVRENRTLRWRVGFLIVGCIALACELAMLRATMHFGGPWHAALAVVATWPLYVLGLYACAKSESRKLELAGHWETLKGHDELGEIMDRETAAKIDRGVGRVWDSLRYQQGGNGGGALLGIFLLTIGTVGTWTIWDLLRMARALVAEIIVDGILVPACPHLADRMPTGSWWKNVFTSTTVHFFAAGFCATGVVLLVKYMEIERASRG
jgi:hypothetical protein